MENLPYYPWYSPVSGDTVEQGDIFEGCPVFYPERVDADEPKLSRLACDFQDVIVMTQSCDMVKGRMSAEKEGKFEVLLCPLVKPSLLGPAHPLATKSGLNEIRAGRRGRYHLLAQSEVPQFESEVRIVTFEFLRSLPLTYIRTRARQRLHLRLLPPYREHLSQAFCSLLYAGRTAAGHSRIPLVSGINPTIRPSAGINLGESPSDRRVMRKILVVVAFALVCSVLPIFAQAHAPASSPPPPAVAATEDGLKKAIQAAQEAHENQETDEEISQWRTAFVSAVQLHSVEAIYVSSLGLDQAFKDGNRPMERTAALRAGVVELKKLGGAGPIWGAQLEVSLAIALEEQGKRVDAGAAAKRAVTVLETALGPKSRDYRETLRTLATLFEEGGNSAAAVEFGRRIDEIDKARESEPVFGYKPDAPIKLLQEQLRTAIDASSAVQIQLGLGQISTNSEKLELKNPFRAKAISDAAIAVLKTSDPGKKLDSNVRPLSMAETLLRKALDLRERAMGSNALADTSKLSLELYHLREYQSEVDTLSNYYASIGETKKQETLLVRALETSERILGKQHPALAGPLRHLGDLYVGTGNKERVNKAAATESVTDDGALDKAIALVKREVEIYEQTFGKQDPILAGSVTRLGELLWMKGDEPAAKACDERASKLQESDAEGKTAEQTMLHEVKQHRAFLRFEEAEDQYETFRKMHPDKSS